MLRRSIICCTVGWLASVTAAYATSYSDRTSFNAALASAGLTAGSDNYESYSLGPISNGDTRGAFTYSFDPSLTQPAVASDGNGGQALGGSPNDVFVGGDAVSLTFTGPRPLQAFGADFFYAPNFEALPGDLYQLEIADGAAAGTTLGNPAGLDANGGSFFLGFIEDPGAAFRSVQIFSVTPLDSSGNPYLDPAYQVDNLAFAASVPEPSLLALLTLGLSLLAFRLRAAR